MMVILQKKVHRLFLSDVIHNPNLKTIQVKNVGCCKIHIDFATPFLSNQFIELTA